MRGIREYKRGDKLLFEASIIFLIVVYVIAIIGCWFEWKNK